MRVVSEVLNHTVAQGERQGLGVACRLDHVHCLLFHASSVFNNEQEFGQNIG